MDIVRLWRRSKPYMPEAVLGAVRAIHRSYMRLRCLRVAMSDKSLEGRYGFPVPPTSLRYRVHGAPDVESFLAVGRQSAADIKGILVRMGRPIDTFNDVLDFGCGCGRTLMAISKNSSPVKLYGTDVDALATAWCRENLDFASFSTNGALPPTDYPPGKFDLVYSISVFSHLNEDFQFQWLGELKRITRPGAIVLLSIHGQECLDELLPQYSEELRQKGFKFFKSDPMKGILPDWYQSAFHTREYVLDRYSTYFDVLEYIPRGSNGYQDMVVLERREG